MGEDLEDFTQLVGDMRASDAARGRARERSLRQQASEQATFDGLLTDLAESGAEIQLRLRSGRTARGVIIGRGADFVALRPRHGGVTVVASAAVSQLRRPGGDRLPQPTGDRAPTTVGTLAAYLSGIAPDRPQVAVATAGEPGLLVGELRSAGRDVLTLALTGDPPAIVYLALDSVESLSSPPG